MFAGYREVELVGEGGLGRVYRAIRESTGGVVAIKELRDLPSASPAWHRARRELDAMLRLKGHPYVVSVEEMFEGPNGPCIVMEYLDGGSLMDRIASGPLAVPELLLVGQQTSQALAAAHDVGIIHRDVKPHNLLVGSFGQVKVGDFGIAALTRDAGVRTQTQAFTLAYASPEELDGESDVGPATDSYSLAATMSHLATGKKPSFRDRTAVAHLDAVTIRDAAMRPVVGALIQCLEVDPECRPTMRAMSNIFAAATAAIGDRRIVRLGAPGSVVDMIAPPSPPPPQAPPDSISREMARLPPTDGDTIIRQPNSPRANKGPIRPIELPTPTPTRGRGRSHRNWAVAIAAVLMLVVGVAAIAAAISRRGSVGAGPTTEPSARSESSTPSTPSNSATTAAPATTVTRSTVATVVATSIPTTPPTTQLAAAPTVATTVPPTAAPPPTPGPVAAAAVSVEAATSVFDDYLELAAIRSYPDAWAMLTVRYQLKYQSYDTFVAFWESVEGADLRGSAAIGEIADGLSLRCYVWYGRRADGTISNEIVEVDVIADPGSGLLLIDDYRYLGQG